MEKIDEMNIFRSICHSLCDQIINDLDKNSLVLEDLFQRLRVQSRRYPERRAFMENPIGTQNVAVRVEVEEIPECLDDNDGSRDWLRVRCTCLPWGHRQARTDTFSGTMASKNTFRESQPKWLSSDGRLRSYRRYRRSFLGVLEVKWRWGTALRISPHSHSPNSTTRFRGGRDKNAFAYRKGEQIFMAENATPDTCKAITKDATIKITGHQLSNVGAEKTILLRKEIVIDVLKRLEMVFHTETGRRSISSRFGMRPDFHRPGRR